MKQSYFYNEMDYYNERDTLNLVYNIKILHQYLLFNQ